jgi:hypothetical protein
MIDTIFEVIVSLIILWFAWGLLCGAGFFVLWLFGFSGLEPPRGKQQ